MNNDKPTYQDLELRIKELEFENLNLKSKEIEISKAKELSNKEAYDLIKNLAEQVPGVIYQYRLYADGKSAFPFSSEGMFDIYEVTSEEVREDASPVFTRIHPEDYDYIVESITQSAKNQTIYNSEFRVILPKQGLRWRQCNAKPELLADGSTLWHGIITDITDRKLAEKALQRSEAELNKAQQITHIGSWYLDIETNNVVWSEELFKMYDFDPTQPVPPYTEHMKLFTPESWEILSTSLAKTRETGIPYELELKTVKKNGTNGWMWVRGEAVKDENDKIIGLWGAAQDITERKQIEEELRKAKEKAEESDRLKTFY